MKVYCPKCRSQRPLVKAGINYQANGKQKQRWQCQNCHKVTVQPLKEPRK